MTSEWLTALDRLMDAMPAPGSGAVSPLPPGCKLAYRVAEAAEMIGIGKEKVQQLCRRGVIPSVKVGAAVLIPALELQAWLSENVGHTIPIDR